MAGANTLHHPHRGSMQFWPRKRAARSLARVRTWKPSEKLAGFIGYKAGMTHLLIKDNNQSSPTKNMDVSTAATIIECPPMKVMSIRLYQKTTSGLKLVKEAFTTKPEKELKRKTGLGKNNDLTGEYDEVRIVAYSLPKKTSIKKVPDVTEIALRGDNALEYAKSLMDKEIKISELFTEGQLIDVHGVTKGKGFQGTVKRYGVKRRQHKSEKTIRGVGTLGSWHPNRVQYTVAQPGKMGYHQRTEYNKILLKIGNKPEEINQKGGITNFGFVKTDYVLVKGSVPGPKKRALILAVALRPWKRFKQPTPEIKYTSTESKQGVR
ncbi:MAG: 50S ribosomal protein L3 [Nanoarchaeota archaeon]|nr:50S ribosomal protein L3 [Nanoarchaeota archaeon]